jgi:hypothetical protein
LDSDCSMEKEYPQIAAPEINESNEVI